MNLSIRKACQEDATGISAIITNAIRQTNAKDYPADFIERLTENFSPERVAERLRFLVEMDKRPGIGIANPIPSDPKKIRGIQTFIKQKLHRHMLTSRDCSTG